VEDSTLVDPREVRVTLREIASLPSFWAVFAGNAARICTVTRTFQNLPGRAEPSLVKGLLLRLVRLPSIQKRLCSRTRFAQTLSHGRRFFDAGCRVRSVGIRTLLCSMPLSLTRQRLTPTTAQTLSSFGHFCPASHNFPPSREREGSRVSGRRLRRRG
jgi:hypothetical protein